MCPDCLSREVNPAETAGTHLKAALRHSESPSNVSDTRWDLVSRVGLTTFRLDQSRSPSPFRSVRKGWDKRAHSLSNSSGEAVLNSNRS